MAVRFVKLHCRGCGSSTCSKKPIGSWSTEKEGCTKEVSGLVGDKYLHYITEVKPLLRQLGDKAPADLWREYLDFMEFIYNIEPGERFRY